MHIIYLNIMYIAARVDATALGFPAALILTYTRLCLFSRER